MNYIAKAFGIWFEGTSAALRVALPQPVVLSASFPGHVATNKEMLFREDYFDAATRVRRGRLYEKGDYNSWKSEDVSFFPYGHAKYEKRAFPNQAYKSAEDSLKPGWVSVLGSGSAQSHWVIVLAERAEDAHYLTLKSKTYFGVLPEVNWEAVPAANRQDIRQALDAVVEAAPIQAPQPVIDACRNAACHMITARFPESNPKREKDLGQIASWLEQEGHRKKKARKADAGATDALIELPDSYASYVVNELHRRAKANATAARCTRPASQQDANLAVDAIAFLLQDFGWAGTGP